MNGEKRVLLVLAIAILAVPCIVQAGPFSAYLKPIQDEITPKEEARFNLFIDNQQEFTDQFQIYYSDIEWIVATDPLTDSLLTIDPGQTKTALVTMRPIKITYGLNGIIMRIRSVKTGDMVFPRVFIDVKTETPTEGRYIPSVQVDIQADKEIDPRETFKARINLKNRNPLDLTGLDVRLLSTAFDVHKQVDLEPFGKVVVEFEIPLNPKEAPRRDTVAVVLSFNNNTFSEFERVYDILDYSMLKKDFGEVRTSFMRSEEDFILTNIGNARKQQVVRMDVPWYSSFTMSADSGAKLSKEDGMRYLVWTVELDPGDQRTITVVTDYRFVFGALLLLILAVYLYFAFRSPVVVRKQVSDIITREGGIYQMKVLLDVRNRSRLPVTNVVIMERLSNLVDVNNDVGVGTLKPTKILRHDRKGALVKWEMQEMQAFEERIIIYIVRAKLTILGEFHLTPTYIRFRDTKGRQRVKRSNRLVITT